MINYFYNIILNTDNCDLYSDVLTSVRKDFFLSSEKLKSKITQNSDADTLFYEFSLEKDRPMKWLVSDDATIISDCKHLEEGKYSINYYDYSGLCKSLLFSKFHTLLKVEYYNMRMSDMPYCTIEPRKSNNGLCLLMTNKNGFNSTVLFSMPDVEDEYVLDKVNAEFTDYSAVASTNEGVVKFLSETQLEQFEEFLDKAYAMKLTECAPKSFIEEGDAELADKLDPKDFNIKRNLSQVVDISQAQEFSFADDEQLKEILSDAVDENISAINEAEAEQVTVPETLTKIDENMTPEIDIDATIAAFLKEEQYPVVYVNKQKAEPIKDIIKEPVAETIEEVVKNAPEETTAPQLALDTEFVTDESTAEVFEIAQEVEPDKVIEVGNTTYHYYGNLDDSKNRSGFGRTTDDNGHTAYEGEYLSNKRDGIGAYYYKDGKLCYFGNWKNNKREGFGVGVSSFDNSVHVGKFKNNKPVGDGVRVSDDGQVQFIKKTLSNGTTVMLKFENDKIIVSKYNANGDKISENSSNLIYF